MTSAGGGAAPSQQLRPSGEAVASAVGLVVTAAILEVLAASSRRTAIVAAALLALAGLSALAFVLPLLATVRLDSGQVEVRRLFRVRSVRVEDVVSIGLVHRMAPGTGAAGYPVLHLADGSKFRLRSQMRSRAASKQQILDLRSSFWPS